MHEQMKILMVIAQRDFRDEEYQVPKRIFLEHGHKVTTASERAGECFGRLGMQTWAEMAIHDINPHDYEAIAFVGGPGAHQYFSDDEALNLAKEFYTDGKIVSAICSASSILANAGILTGKRATAFESEQANLEAKGAIYTGNLFEVDGNIITANGPDAADEFAEEILKKLS